MMTPALENLSPVKRRMHITWNAAELEERVDHKLNELAPQMNMKGFRPGKVPKQFINKRFYPEIRREVISDYVIKAIEDGVKANDVELANQPQIEYQSNEKGSDLVCTVTFDIYPEITLKGLDKLQLDKPVVEINDADIDQQIEDLRQQFKTFAAVDRAAQEGDRVKVDVETFLKKDPTGENSTGLWVELGASRTLKELEEALVGVKPSDDKEVVIKHDKEHPYEAFRGKKVTYKIHVHEIEESVVPEVGEELFAKVGVDNLQALQDKMRENMQNQLSQKIKNIERDQLVEQLLKNHSFELPPSLVEASEQQLKSRYAGQLGIDLNSPQAQQLLKEDMFKDEANRSVSLQLLLKAFAKEKDIRFDEKAFMENAGHLLAGLDNPEFAKPKYKAMVQNYVNNQKQIYFEDQLFEALLALAKVTEKQLSFKEVMEYKVLAN